jgi:hypothetical protein
MHFLFIHLCLNRKTPDTRKFSPCIISGNRYLGLWLKSFPHIMGLLLALTYNSVLRIFSLPKSAFLSTIYHHRCVLLNGRVS